MALKSRGKCSKYYVLSIKRFFASSHNTYYLILNTYFTNCRSSQMKFADSLADELLLTFLSLKPAGISPVKAQATSGKPVLGKDLASVVATPITFGSLLMFMLGLNSLLIMLVLVLVLVFSIQTS